MKSVASNSALGTLTIASNELASDTVMQLIIKIASPLQLTVKQAKKAALQLELPSGKTLQQRNAIVRCLCGLGLHNALDNTLTGGHMASFAASPTHAMAVASISSWMSVADHHDASSLLPQLESHLETRAFLVPSATCTVADVDVAVVVAKKGDSYKSFPNVHRWLVTVQAFLNEHGVVDASMAKIEPIAKSHGPPVFFYGTEENVVLPKKKAAAPAPTQGKQMQQPQQQGKGKKQQQQQQEGKKDKPKKQQQQQAPATFDIGALDIRVGKILKVWPHEEAEKLFCEEIDLGNGEVRKIASGLRPFYKTEELQDQVVMVLCNLKQRNLVGFPSHGMVMCASNADHTSVEIMSPPAGAKIGERVLFGDYTKDNKEPEPENKVAKKKIFESVAPDLKTNAEGVLVWKEATGETTAGPVKASKGMAGAQVA